MAWKIDGCSNVSFFEDDGYCTRCGRNHLQIIERNRKSSIRKMNPNSPYTPKFHTPKVEPVQVKTTVKVDQHPAYKIARETVELLSELYGIEIDIEVNPRRNASLAYGTTKISFGNATEWFFENGYRSRYVTCTRLAKKVLGKLATGNEAVKVHACHEFAHIIDDHLGTYRGRSHGKPFMLHFENILNLVF